MFQNHFFHWDFAFIDFEEFEQIFLCNWFCVWRNLSRFLPPPLPLHKNFSFSLFLINFSCFLYAFQRYYAIVHPLRPRQSHRRLLVSITVIWAFSALISLPTLFYSTTVEVTINENSLESMTTLATPIHDNFSKQFSTKTVNSVLNNINESSTISSIYQSSDTDTILKQTTGNGNTGQHIPSTNVERIWLALLAGQNHAVSESPIRILAQKRTLCVIHWPDGYSGFSFMEFL